MRYTRTLLWVLEQTVSAIHNAIIVMKAAVASTICASMVLSATAPSERHCEGSHCVEQEKLFGWIERNGGYIHPSIELSTGNDPSWKIRGIFAIEDIRENEVICELPSNLLMCVANDDSDVSECTLVQRLANEMSKAGKSFYGPYVDSMASHHLDLPAVWSLEERQWFSELYPDDWTRHVAWFENICHGDRSDYGSMRAMQLVVSRSNTVDEGACLSPLYDSFNHAGFGLQNVEAGYADGKLIMTATADVPAGGQMFNNFGEETMGRMLRDYGFLADIPRGWELEAADGQLHMFFEEYDEFGNVVINLSVDVLEYSLEDKINALKSLREKLEFLMDNEPTEVDIKSLDPVQLARFELAAAYREGYMHALRWALRSLKDAIEKESADRTLEF